jgi:hypothetical protein
MDWPVAVVICCGVLLIAVIVWQVMATGRTAVVQEYQKEIAIQIKQDTESVLDEFRAVIADLVAGQREISEGITEIRTRVTAIEKILRDVE